MIGRAEGIGVIQLLHQFLVNMRTEWLAACEYFECDVMETVSLHHDPGVLLVLGTAQLKRPRLAPASDPLNCPLRIPFQNSALPYTALRPEFFRLAPGEAAERHRIARHGQMAKQGISQQP